MDSGAIVLPQVLLIMTNSSRHFKFIALLVLLYHMATVLNAQSNYQTVQIKVIDQASKTALSGVRCTIPLTDTVLTAFSDSLGVARLSMVPYGRYDIKCDLEKYQQVIIYNVLVTSGKEVELDVEMKEQVTQFGGSVVKGTKKNTTINSMSVVSARSFSMEEVNRFSGGHGDPSRLVANFAGVSAPNDSRNDIVVRGNSPTGVLWRIEGLNIPNPNHFSTMGTTGGPVSALNTNILRNSDFLTSAFAPEYGNALAGVFELGFRNGNKNKHENMFQMGMFTGLELMTEGPIGKKKKVSYVIAGRYSFTGLAQNMGMNLGTTAVPKYQDISFKFNFKPSKAGTFSVFGLGGVSTINFMHDPNDSTDIYSDRSKDAYNTSKIGFVGMSHFISIGKNSYFKSVVGVSGSLNTYNQDSVNALENENTIRMTELKTSQLNYTLNSSFNSKVSSKLKYKIGVIAELMELNLFDRDKLNSVDWTTIYDSHDYTALIQAYGQGAYSVNERLTLTGGVHSQYLALNNSRSFEPRIAMNYQLSKRSSFSMGYGTHKQMQALTTYFYESRNADGTYAKTNQNLDFTSSRHFVVGYDFLPAKDWRIKTEAYYQYLSQVPVCNVPNSYSVLNQGASFSSAHYDHLVNSGTGYNYGAELTLEKFFSKGYYGLLTGSLYSSKYKGSDQVLRNTAFNGNYTINVLAGKEFKVSKDGRKVFTFDTKFTGAGGKYYTPTDLTASRLAHKQVFMGDQLAYSARYSDYLRWDVKFGIRVNSKTRKISQTFFIDVQNVTNHMNVLASGYNPKTNQINTAYQSGFLPNFMYRINF